jgi:putative acetyltransferase
MISNRPESAADHDAIRQVNRLAFGQDDEARLVDALRDGGYIRVSLMAERDRQIVGHILFSDLPIITDSDTIPALALAPMAVLPDFQRQGIGSELVRRGLDVCRQQGHRIVIVLGHPEFYPRFGFSPGLARPLQSPFSGEAWMATELVPRALEGVAGRVEYPPPFGVLRTSFVRILALLDADLTSRKVADQRNLETPSAARFPRFLAQSSEAETSVARWMARRACSTVCRCWTN